MIAESASIIRGRIATSFEYIIRHIIILVSITSSTSFCRRKGEEVTSQINFTSFGNRAL
jgi:hypothetical protein